MTKLSFWLVVLEVAFTLACWIIIATGQDAGHQATLWLTWTATGDDGHEGTADVYDLRTSQTPITTLADFYAAARIPTRPPKPAGSRELLFVDSLPEERTLYFRIRAGDELRTVRRCDTLADTCWNDTTRNWSDMSNLAEITTGEHTAPAAILDLSAQ